jgi:hypothetical protein
MSLDFTRFLQWVRGEDVRSKGDLRSWTGSGPLHLDNHRHDYEMIFEGNGLDFKLVCRCGDIAPDMEEALRRMKANG